MVPWGVRVLGQQHGTWIGGISYRLQMYKKVLNATYSRGTCEVLADFPLFFSFILQFNNWLLTLFKCG